MTLGLVDLAVQAVAGTKLAANAALRRTLDEEKLRQLLDWVESVVGELEAQNQGEDDGGPARLSEKLANPQALRHRVGQALEELPDRERPNRYKRTNRINLTDKDARLMQTRQGIGPGNNAQAMMSPLSEDGGVVGVLVTATEVVDEANDAAQLTPMAEQAEEMTGIRVPMTLADAGYFIGKHVAEFHRRGQQTVMPELARPSNYPYHKDQFSYDGENDSYTCPHGQRLHPARLKDNNKKKPRVYRLASGSTRRDYPAFGVCTTNASQGRTLEIRIHEAELRRHREWMATDEAQRVYQRR